VLSYVFTKVSSPRLKASYNPSDSSLERAVDVAINQMAQFEKGLQLNCKDHVERLKLLSHSYLSLVLQDWSALKNDETRTAAISPYSYVLQFETPESLADPTPQNLSAEDQMECPYCSGKPKETFKPVAGQPFDAPLCKRHLKKIKKHYESAGCTDYRSPFEFADDHPELVGFFQVPESWIEVEATPVHEGIAAGISEDSGESSWHAGILTPLSEIGSWEMSVNGSDSENMDWLNDIIDSNTPAVNSD
jgi:hypothetical protein